MINCKFKITCLVFFLCFVYIRALTGLDPLASCMGCYNLLILYLLFYILIVSYLIIFFALKCRCCVLFNLQWLTLINVLNTSVLGMFLVSMKQNKIGPIFHMVCSWKRAVCSLWIAYLGFKCCLKCVWLAFWQKLNAFLGDPAVQVNFQKPEKDYLKIPLLSYLIYPLEERYLSGQYQLGNLE